MSDYAWLMLAIIIIISGCYGGIAFDHYNKTQIEIAKINAGVKN